MDWSRRMTRRRLFLFTGSTLSACVLALCLVSGGVLSSGARLGAAAPPKLTDQEFWKVSSESSEPDGNFRSDNLLSNEIGMQWVIPDLVANAKQGRAYLGV